MMALYWSISADAFKAASGAIASAHYDIRREPLFDLKHINPFTDLRVFGKSDR
jgi:hypothetical protein